MAELISIKKVGFLKWESIVEAPHNLYYFYGFTRRGAEKQANEQLEKYDDRSGGQDTPT